MSTIDYAKIPLYSLEDERITLAVILKDPHFIADLQHFDLKPTIYHNPVHQALFSAIIATYNENGTAEPYLVSNKLKTIGIEKIEGVDIFLFIQECLLEIPIDKESYPQYFENVIKAYEGRVMDERFREGRKWIRDNRHQSRKKISEYAASFADDISTLSVQNMEDDLVDFYGELQSRVEAVADNPATQGLFSPFPTFNKWFGMFKFSNVYCFSAASKVGKTTLMNFFGDHFVTSGGGKTHVLMGDTEMTAEENMMRFMAARTGINAVEFEEGTYVDKPEFKQAAQKVFGNTKQYAGLLHHISCGSKTIQEFESFCRRYHRKYVKEDENLVIIYDYIKLTGEDTTENPEWKVIGEKANSLKQLAGSLPRTLIITSVQLNEQGGVSQSARIMWFLTNIFKLVLKSDQEIYDGGFKFGSHRLEHVKTRFLGREGREAQTPIRVIVKDEKGKDKMQTRKNAINLHIDGFHITEKGTYKEEIDALLADGKQLTPIEGESKYTPYRGF